MSQAHLDPRLPSLALFQNPNDITITRASQIRIPSRTLHRERRERDITSGMSTSTMAGLRLASVVLVLVLFVPYLSLRRVSYDYSLSQDTTTPKMAADSPPIAQRLIASSLRINKSLTGTSSPYKEITQATNDSMSTLPQSVFYALQDVHQNGYLLGNASWLTFHPYDYEVALRVIVLAFNRPKSLHKCLLSLSRVDFLNDSVSVHVWLDRHNVTGKVDEATYNVAKTFNFLHGAYHVHVQPSHAGIQAQWINTWRPNINSNEIAVILEDDLTVSKFFWLWLKRAHEAYDARKDISGYGLSHPGISHLAGLTLDVPSVHNVFLYKVICTWGFSPHRDSWREFQKWFYESEQDNSFQPLVPDILPTRWFLEEAQSGRQKELWEMWHIYFTHNHDPNQVRPKEG